MNDLAENRHQTVLGRTLVRWRTALMTSLITLTTLVDGERLIAQRPPVDQQKTTSEAGQTLHISTHGLGRYLPGRWGTLLIEATNQGPEPAEVNSAAWIEGREDEQFGRSVWLPAQSRRITSMPVLIPPRPFTPGDAGPQLYWMGVREADGQEVLTKSANRDHIETRELIMPRALSVFAVITDSTNRQMELSELLRGVFGKDHLQSVVLPFEPAQLPTMPESLDAVSTLIVMGDQLAENAAAVDVVQEWSRRGGTLWLMLDTMSFESAQFIAGGDLQIHELDRITMTSYALHSTSNSTSPEPDVVDLEQPVHLVRTFAEETSILSEVNDWPAAVVTPFGQGRILVSTLSLDGWFVPGRIQNASKSGQPDDRLWITTAGHDLMASLHGVGSEVPLDANEMADYVTSRIGYQLPVRFSGATVLACYCVLLIVICSVVHRLQKPVLLLPGIAILSSLVVSVFIVIAESSHTTPDGTVVFQLVEAEGTQDRLMASGILAFHSRDRSRPAIHSSVGGRLDFEGSISSGKPVRTVWTDDHKWRMKNVSLSAGVRLASFEQPIPTSRSVEVRGTFDEAGFSGHLLGDLTTPLEDAVLAGPTGFSLPVRIDSAGEIDAGGSSPLPPGQYLASGLVDAEQARRQEVYRRLFDASRRRQIFPQRMTILAWSDPLKLQTGPLTKEPPVGAMLITIPVIVDRPAIGQRVRIPSTFLPYRSISNRKLKIGYAPTFSNSRRTWTPNTSPGPSTSLLQFELPESLLPLRVDKARLILKLSAPLRNVEISSGHPDALETVWSRESPVGRFEIPFGDAASRQLNSNDGFVVALSVGGVQLEELQQSELGTQDRNWQVEWMQLELEGLIQ